MSRGWLTVGALLAYLCLTDQLSWQRLLLFVLGIIALILFLLWRYQEHLLYQPRIFPQYATPQQNPVGFRSPLEHGIPFEDIYITTPDNIRLHLWFLRPIRMEERLNRPTIIFFHANAGNKGFRLDNLKSMYFSLGANVMILSYRGYGNSEGSPQEQGILIDAETVWKYVQSREDIDKKRIFLFGRSLGGSVAIALASRHSAAIAGTILENTFTCISDMVDIMFPLLSYLKKWIVRLHWPAVERIALITHPMLFMAGMKDEIVPHSHMKELYAKAIKASKKEFFAVENGLHNNTWMEGGMAYLQKFARFLSESPAAANGETVEAKDIEAMKVETQEFNHERAQEFFRSAGFQTFQAAPGGSTLPQPMINLSAALAGAATTRDQKQEEGPKIELIDDEEEDSSRSKQE